MNGKYYVPDAVLNQPARIYHATYTRVNGVMNKTYETDDEIFWVAAKSYGGTEEVIDGIYTVIDTVEFTAYYNPNLHSEDRIELVGNGDMFDILNTPENIDMRGAFMRFKGRRINAKA